MCTVTMYLTTHHEVPLVNHCYEEKKHATQSEHIHFTLMNVMSTGIL